MYVCISEFCLFPNSLVAPHSQWYGRRESTVDDIADAYEEGNNRAHSVGRSAPRRSAMVGGEPVPTNRLAAQRKRENTATKREQQKEHKAQRPQKKSYKVYS